MPEESTLPRENFAVAPTGKSPLAFVILSHLLRRLAIATNAGQEVVAGAGPDPNAAPGTNTQSR